MKKPDCAYFANSAGVALLHSWVYSLLVFKVQMNVMSALKCGVLMRFCGLPLMVP